MESWNSPRPQHGEPREVHVGIGELDPPTMLIQDFLQRQKDSGTLSLDMDMDMLFMLPTYTTPPTQGASQKPNLPSQLPASTILSIPPDPHPSPLVGPNSINKTMVSFEENIASPPRDPLLGNARPTPPPPCKREKKVSSSSPPHSSSSSSLSSSLLSSSSSGSNSDSEEEEELLAPSRRCLRSNSLGGCVRKRSRLADIRYVPLPQALMQQVSNHRSGGKSSQLRSGPIRSGAMLNRTRFLGKVDEELLEVEEMEEDPLEGDLPESFHKTRCGVWYIVEWAAFVFVMAALPCTFALPRLKHRLLVGMELWKWALLVFLLFSGRLVSRWLVRVVVLLLERSFVMRKKVLYFVYALRRGVQNLLWFTFAVLEWRFVFNPKIESTSPKNLVVLNWVTQLLYCFLIAAIVWLVKTFCVKVVASSFHINTYFDRIQESLFSQYVLETLSQPPIMDMDDLFKDNDSKFMNEVDSLKKAGAKLPECIASLPKQSVGTQQEVPQGTKTNKSGISKFSWGVKTSGIIMGAKSGLLKNEKGNQQEEKDRENGEVGIAMNLVHRLNQQNISAWHMKRLVKFVTSRGISILVTAMNESATHSKGNINEQEDGEIQSEWQARLVARKIFKNVAKPGSKSIMVDDLGRFMSLKEVLKAMPLFEGAMESGAVITKDSLKNFVVYVFRERLALALSLKDTKTAVKKLHKIINVVAALIIFVISILVLGLATTHILLLVSSQLVLVVFIFGNTVKTLFEAIIFLFVMHPFDVGDRCLVEDNQVVVEEMNILSTLFLKSDGEKIWYPNSVLATKRITNYYHTPDTGDTFNFSVHVSTPIEKMIALEENIGRYLASKPNHWTSEMHLMVLEIEDMNRMKIQLMVNHTIDYPDVLERQIRRSNLILEVKRIFEEIGMEYHLLPQDVRLVPFST